MSTLVCASSLGRIVFALALSVSTLVATRSVQAQTFAVLHTFAGPEGASPYAGVTVDAAGNLYGTTFVGGGLLDGTVFELKHSASAYTSKTLHNFTAAGGDGAIPMGGVVFGPDGALYGADSEGGDFFQGTVFNVRPPGTVCKSAVCPWTETKLYAFQGRYAEYADGANPYYGEVAFDQAGNIYGTTRNEGAYGLGIVYQLSRSGEGWRENILHTFSGSGDGDGAWPDHNVIVDSYGNLYGTTSLGGVYGGEYGGGTVFQLTSSGSDWTYKVIANFPPQGRAKLGSYLQAGLISDQAGNLYGATSDGQTRGGGAVFELSPSSNGWKLTLLHAFSEQTEHGPVGNLVMDSRGNLYGTTIGLGVYGWGNVFKLSRSGGGWTYTDLHDFTNGSDGSQPTGDLSMDANGNLFGTTQTGGLYSLGVVWEITP